MKRNNITIVMIILSALMLGAIFISLNYYMKPTFKNGEMVRSIITNKVGMVVQFNSMNQKYKVAFYTNGKQGNIFYVYMKEFELQKTNQLLKE